MRTKYKNSFFKIWKERIEKHIYKMTELNLDDLPDEPYRIWFEETNYNPKDIA